MYYFDDLVDILSNIHTKTVMNHSIVLLLFSTFLKNIYILCNMQIIYALNLLIISYFWKIVFLNYIKTYLWKNSY